MRIVVGVSGGIAAYKACELVSRLVKAGHEVRVVMTPAAAQFVAPLTFRALSGQEVGLRSDDEPVGPLSHVKLAHWADALVIAPASASLMARLAQGHAVDMLGLVYLGFRGPVLVAPAMEPEMWDHPRTRENCRILTEDGVNWVGPGFGRMASGLEGLGRLAEPADIVDALDVLLAPKDLGHLSMVVTAGSTWEHFDPVRILTNPSTGLMGVLVANQAARRGARVTLVAGPSVTVPVDPRVHRESAVSAVDMLDAVREALRYADVMVGTAAVSDFRPKTRLLQKAHKDQTGLEWAMERNPDIIQTMAQEFREQKLFVGFAAETENPVEQAEAKRRRKQLDAVVANLVGEGIGFGTGAHQAWLVTRDGVQQLPGGTKAQTATALLDWIARERPETC